MNSHMRAPRSVTDTPTDEEGFALLFALGMPFQEEGRPGQVDEEAEAREEERRHEEARARAEAEQAALEELKQENPDAYARPEPTVEDDHPGGSTPRVPPAEGATEEGSE